MQYITLLQFAILINSYKECVSPCSRNECISNNNTAVNTVYSYLVYQNNADKKILI